MTRLRKPLATVEIEKVGETVVEAQFVRQAKDEAEANKVQELDQVAYLLEPVVELSNPTGQIRGEEEVTPLKAHVDVDAKYAIASQLEELIQIL